MKKQIITAIAMVMLSACTCVTKEPVEHHRKCALYLQNGHGISTMASVVECDSFQMFGQRKAFVWIDGYKMNVEAERILPNVK